MPCTQHIHMERVCGRLAAPNTRAQLHRHTVLGPPPAHPHLSALAATSVSACTHSCPASAVQVLRMALHEIIHNEQPPHVVNAFVELAKALPLGQRGGNFANAVLHAFLRDRAGGKDVLPPLPAAPAGVSADTCAAALRAAAACAIGLLRQCCARRM